MRTKFVEIKLTRKALNKHSSEKTSDKISVYDFHSDFLSMQEINYSDNIIFVDDDGSEHILKQRYRK